MIPYKQGDLVKIIYSNYDEDVSKIDIATVIISWDGIALGWKQDQSVSEAAWENRYGFTLPEDFTKFVWYFPHQFTLEIVTVITTVGHICISCKEYYPDAVSNLPNNKLKCWSCKNS